MPQARPPQPAEIRGLKVELDNAIKAHQAGQIGRAGKTNIIRVLRLE